MDKPKLLSQKMEIIEQRQLNGTTLLVVGNKDDDRYLIMDMKFKKMVDYAVQLLDGERTCEEINQYLLENCSLRTNIEPLVKRFASIGLIENAQPSPDNSEIDAVGIRILNIKFKGMNPYVRTVFSGLLKAGRFLLITLLILFIPLFLLLFDRFLDRDIVGILINGNSLVKVGIYYIIVSWCVLFIHEIAHITAIAYNGLSLQQISVSLYMGLYPLYYSKARGIYRIPVRNRMQIIVSGLAANLFMFLGSLLLLVLIPVRSEFYLWVMLIFIDNFFMLTSNCSPFKLSDGYFIFSSLLGIYGIRSKMFKTGFRHFGRTFRKNKTKALLNISYYIVFIVMMLITTVTVGAYCYGLYLELHRNYPVFVSYLFIGIGVVYVGFVIYSLIKRRNYWRNSSNDD
jgi:hypothetical protein